MRLAEAIRKGATMRPIARGVFFGYSSTGKLLRTCAIGSAVEGRTGRLERAEEVTDRRDAALAYFDAELSRPSGPCPVLRCRAVATTDAGTITHLNDDHRWSRERIADWLDARDGIPTPAELSA